MNHVTHNEPHSKKEKSSLFEQTRAAATKLNNAKKGDDAETVLKESGWFLDFSNAI